MNRLTLLFAAFVLSLSQNVRADDSGAYIGAGVATDGARNGCLKSGVTATCNNYTTTSTNGHLHIIGGYNFNKFVGVEGGYENFGTYKVADAFGTFVGTAQVSAFTLAARGGYKFHFGLSVFGKLGLAAVQTQYTPGAGWPLTVNNNQKSTGVVVGLGVQYDFNDYMGIRLSREAIGYSDSASDAGVAATSLLAVVRF